MIAQAPVRGRFIALLKVLLALAAALATLSGCLDPALTSVTPPKAGQGATPFEVVFTQPASARHSGPDARLVALLDAAARSVDVAVYDFDLENVAAALARAKGRGLRVRVVTDGDTVANTGHRFIQAALATLRGAGIPVVADSRPAYMHHKFTVVDEEWVQTGSWNYTHADTTRHDNNALFVRDRDLAANYTAEFERLFTRREFGPQKFAGSPRPVLTIGSVRVESYFSPKDEVAAKIIATLATARESVYFLAFALTHDGIGQAVLDRAREGVFVSGVFETSGADDEASEYSTMKRAGLEVYKDANPYAMHHKVIVVDERVVIVGSFNFSRNADESNDENVLIIHDPSLAKQYREEFLRVRDLARNPPRR